MRVHALAAVCVVLLAVSAATPVRADMPPGSREELKGLTSVYVDADPASRGVIISSLARELPRVSLVDRETDAEIVLRFTATSSFAYRDVQREVTRTVPNPDWRPLTDEERMEGKIEPDLVIRVTRWETESVYVPVARASGTVLRRLPSTALHGALSFFDEVTESGGTVQLAKEFSHWFAKEYRKANKP
jgi:hypothetical protein